MLPVQFDFDVGAPGAVVERWRDTEDTFQAASALFPSNGLRSGPDTFASIGAHFLWNSTVRAAMGCSFGADVRPGMCDTLMISCQMSSFLISGRHCLK